MSVSDIEITEDDVRSLAEKLATFCQALKPGERAAFESVEQYLAAVAGEDAAEIQGYVYVVEDETTGAVGVTAVEETGATTPTTAPTDRATLWRTVLTNLTGT